MPSASDFQSDKAAFCRRGPGGPRYLIQFDGPGAIGYPEPFGPLQRKPASPGSAGTVGIL